MSIREFKRRNKLIRKADGGIKTGTSEFEEFKKKLNESFNQNIRDQNLTSVDEDFDALNEKYDIAKNNFDIMKLYNGDIRAVMNLYTYDSKGRLVKKKEGEFDLSRDKGVALQRDNDENVKWIDQDFEERKLTPTEQRLQQLNTDAASGVTYTEGENGNIKKISTNVRYNDADGNLYYYDDNTGEEYKMRKNDDGSYSAYKSALTGDATIDQALKDIGQTETEVYRLNPTQNLLDEVVATGHSVGGHGGYLNYLFDLYNRYSKGQLTNDEAIRNIMYIGNAVGIDAKTGAPMVEQATMAYNPKYQGISTILDQALGAPRTETVPLFKEDTWMDQFQRYWNDPHTLGGMLWDYTKYPLMSYPIK